MARPKGSKNKKMLEVEKPQERASVKITLKSLGRIFTSVGATLEDAVNKIKVSNGIKVTSVMTVQSGDYKKERILNGRIAHQLFGQCSPTTKEIYLKKVHELFGV